MKYLSQKVRQFSKVIRSYSKHDKMYNSTKNKSKKKWKNVLFSLYVKESKKFVVVDVKFSILCFRIYNYYFFWCVIKFPLRKPKLRKNYLNCFRKVSLCAKKLWMFFIYLFIWHTVRCRKKNTLNIFFSIFHLNLFTLLFVKMHSRQWIAYILF